MPDKSKILADRAEEKNYYDWSKKVVQVWVFNSDCSNYGRNYANCHNYEEDPILNDPYPRGFT